MTHYGYLPDPAQTWTLMYYLLFCSSFFFSLYDQLTIKSITFRLLVLEYSCFSQTCSIWKVETESSYSFSGFFVIFHLVFSLRARVQGLNNAIHLLYNILGMEGWLRDTVWWMLGLDSLICHGIPYTNTRPAQMCSLYPWCGVLLILGCGSSFYTEVWFLQ